MGKGPGEGRICYDALGSGGSFVAYGFVCTPILPIYPFNRMASRFFHPLLLLALFAFPLAPATATAQIASDRPGFGDGASTVGLQTFQAELGYAFQGNGFNSHNLGQLLLRYGATDYLELRGGVGSYVINEDPVDNGYAGTTVGAKARLFRSQTSTLSALATLGLPTGTGFFDSSDDRARQELKLAFDGALGTNLTLSINGGVRFFYTDDAAEEVLFIPTLSLAVSPNVSTYVGYAGFYDDGTNTNFVEGGITFFPNADTQLDLNTGLRMDENSDDFFVGVGLARRF